MNSLVFLFHSFGFLSWLFLLGAVLLGVATAYRRWSSSVDVLLRLRREQSQLREDLVRARRAVAATSSATSTRVHPRPGSARRPLDLLRSSSVPSPGAPSPGAPPLHAPTAPRTVSPEPAPTGSSPRTRRHSVREDRQLGLVYYLAPDDPDPLERLPGITSGQVRELNVLGVYRFEQIARWTDTNVRSFALLMGIEEREILEHQWVREARTLHGELHGSEMVLPA